MELTPHFALEEFERSTTAQRLGIDNHAPVMVITNLQHLCQQVLEPLRRWYGAPLVVSSGYRSLALNRRVGGSKTSQHRTGQAADIVLARHADNVELYNAELRRLYDHIRLHLPFDQLIWEQSRRHARCWLHVSYRTQGNRRQAFTLTKG